MYIEYAKILFMIVEEKDKISTSNYHVRSLSLENNKNNIDMCCSVIRDFWLWPSSVYISAGALANNVLYSIIVFQF